MRTAFRSFGRVIAFLIVYAIVTLFWVGCESRNDREADRIQREKSGKALQQQHRGTSDAIRDYQQHKTAPAPEKGRKP